MVLHYIKQLTHNFMRSVCGHGQPVVVTADHHELDPSLLDERAVWVLKTLHNAGFSAYIVGGAVRDLLSGCKPKDFDCVTDAHPEEVKALFPRSLLIGRRFRLVHVRFAKEYIEVSTFRGGHAASEQDRHWERGMLVRDNVYGDMCSDVYRRDFTVNALYYDAKENIIIDYVGGFADVQSKVMKVIGRPRKRFHEDPIRILRAVRLAAKLGYHIEPATASAIVHMKNLLLEVSGNRLFLELMKMFYSGHALGSLRYLEKYQLFGLLFPQVKEMIATSQMDGQVSVMVEQGLYNTDRRFHADLPLSSAFLFAVLLWYPYLMSLRCQGDRQLSTHERKHAASERVIRTQQQVISIPKNVVMSIKNIWMLQPSLLLSAKMDPWRILSHPRFRAGYDFLVLRAQAGEPVGWDALWWERFQHADNYQRNCMVKKLRASS